MAKKYTLAAVLIALILIVGLFFGLSYLRSHPKTQAPQSAVLETEQTIENPKTLTPEAAQKTDNTSAAQTLAPTPEMETVIEENAADLNNPDVTQDLAPSYPDNVIPLYKASAAADSEDIITENGRPGWTAQYGSDASVEEVSAFYTELLKNAPDFKSEQNAQSTRLTATIDGCSAAVTVSPNNPERTGLSNVSNVSIFIERN